MKKKKKNESETPAEKSQQKTSGCNSILKLLCSRPKKITKEEITFFREQRICLVCKGKVVKYNFVCNCDALYCVPCVEALIELENICWACNNPLDDTKPIKQIEKLEQDDILVEPEEKDQKLKNI